MDRLDIKISGKVLPDDRDPLRKIVKFFDYWKNRRYDKMQDVLQISWVDKITEFGLEENLKSLFNTKPVKIRILNHRFINNVVFDAEIKIKHQIARKVFRVETRHARVICEALPMVPSPDGSWGLNPNSVQV